MGNDGGSIPDRRDLVKNKPKAEQADKNNQIIAAWFFCALSKKPLQEPIVSCELGKLYNKDAVIEYLLDKTAYGDGERICGHIRTLKDVKSLKFTRNPLEVAESDADAGRRHAMFICPLTLREMSGQVPFVYISTCGDVFSAAGLRTISTSSSTSSPPSSSSTPPAEDEAQKAPTLDLCPQCGTKFDKSRDVRTINPPPDVEMKLREVMLNQRAAAKAAKSSKKRKAVDGVEASSGVEGVESSKRSKKADADGSAAPAPSTNASFAAVNKKVAQELADEEKRRKSTMSSAVASLYSKKDAKPAKETFLTMGTFTRYA